MKASEAKLLAFLRKSSQFVIPIYQRTYSWTDKECRQLWDDIIRAGNNDAISVHFVGSIVYIEDGLSQVSDQAPLLVIDGQQRLTTLTLLLAALAEAVGEGEPLDGFSASKIRNRYLVDPEETGERSHKLLLSQTDRETLSAIVAGRELPNPASVRISENFALFRDLLAKQAGNLEPVCNGLSKLVVVDIALSREHDNPQLIFESMNSTGRELSQADLIRNFILMGLEPDLQTRLYQDYWRPMETDFGQEAYVSHFDGFMRNYLTVATGDIPRVGEVYEAFKEHARNEDAKGTSVEQLVHDVREHARYFCAFALGHEPDPTLRQAFQDLRELKVDVAYPFLLELYRDFQKGLLTKEAFVEAIRLTEAFVFRRAVCAIPTNSMNKTFATFLRDVDKTRYLDGIKAHFLLLPSYRRFPLDDEFEREIKERDLYNFRSRSYWLRRLENYGRKEPVSVDEYTIEHIMPQNPNLPADWQAALGPDWERVHETYLHKLGNLTLTGYNSEYQDRPFAQKRDMEGGFVESPLFLNRGLGQVQTWDEEAIKARADRLAVQVVSVWASPKMPSEALDGYRPKPSAKNSYSIEDHPHLLSPAVAEIFAAFRREVLALDPGVTEEFLKLYVAYKAETNFVDVAPQAKALLLSINLPFPEISDPRGLGRDVSGMRRWGNGDIEVRLLELAELPYVMGLVRQALEKQLGSEGN